MSNQINLVLYRQAVIDDEHLKLLSIGYMISAGFNALFSLFGLFYIFMGILFSQVVSKVPQPNNSADQPPPAFFGWIFGTIGLIFMTAFITLAILKFVAAGRLKQRKSRVFCMVVAAITCLGFPDGTALGVMTFICLGRQSVERLFDVPAPSVPPAQPV